jgi:hypothetical protein
MVNIAMTANEWFLYHKNRFLNLFKKKEEKEKKVCEICAATLAFDGHRYLCEHCRAARELFEEARVKVYQIELPPVVTKQCRICQTMFALKEGCNTDLCSNACYVEADRLRRVENDRLRRVEVEVEARASQSPSADRWFAEINDILENDWYLKACNLLQVTPTPITIKEPTPVEPKEEITKELPKFRKLKIT